MHVIENVTSEQRITQLTSILEEDSCLLRWQWPEHISHVYIYRTTTDEPSSSILLHAGERRLYMKEEYKRNNGFRDPIDTIGRLRYLVYPCVLQDGQLQLLKQQDGANQVEISTGKAIIRYKLHQKTGLFQKYKTLRMELHTEVPLDKDVLCYVKKEGAPPQHKEDGIYYPFGQSFAVGKTLLPAIEIGKKDYIRLFFTDGRKYGHVYELIAD